MFLYSHTFQRLTAMTEPVLIVDIDRGETMEVTLAQARADTVWLQVPNTHVSFVMRWDSLRNSFRGELGARVFELKRSKKTDGPAHGARGTSRVRQNGEKNSEAARATSRWQGR